MCAGWRPCATSVIAPGSKAGAYLEAQLWPTGLLSYIYRAYMVASTQGEPRAADFHGGGRWTARLSDETAVEMEAARGQAMQDIAVTASVVPQPLPAHPDGAELCCKRSSDICRIAQEQQCCFLGAGRRILAGGGGRNESSGGRIQCG